MALNVFERSTDAVGHEQEVEVFEIDGASCREVMEHVEQRLPIPGSDQRHGKVLNLPGLDEGQRFE